MEILRIIVFCFIMIGVFAIGAQTGILIERAKNLRVGKRIFEEWKRVADAEKKRRKAVLNDARKQEPSKVGG